MSGFQPTLRTYVLRRKRWNVKDNRPPLRIWSQDYNPMILGGDVHRPMSCDVTTYGESFTLVGVSIRTVVRPDGVLAFIEPSGGIVGSELAVLRRDLMKCTPKLIREQIAESKKQCAAASLIPEEKFWEKMGVKPVAGLKTWKARQ